MAKLHQTECESNEKKDGTNETKNYFCINDFNT